MTDSSSSDKILTFNNDWVAAAGFGVLVAAAARLDVPSMVRDPIASALGGTLGGWAGDLGNVVVFLALYAAYDWYILPQLKKSF